RFVTVRTAGGGQYSRVALVHQHSPPRLCAQAEPASAAKLFYMDRRKFRSKASMAKQLIEIYPVVPTTLARLAELSNNLFFSWHRPTRALFEDLDPELWKQAS